MVMINYYTVDTVDFKSYLFKNNIVLNYDMEIGNQ